MKSDIEEFLKSFGYKEGYRDEWKDYVDGFKCLYKVLNTKEKIGLCVLELQMNLIFK